MDWTQDTCPSRRDPGLLQAFFLITSCCVLGWGCLVWQGANQSERKTASANKASSSWVQGKMRKWHFRRSLAAEEGGLAPGWVVLGRIDARALSFTKHRQTDSFQSTHMDVILILHELIWPRDKRAANKKWVSHVFWNFINPSYKTAPL